jgi:hypothetical protein
MWADIFTIEDDVNLMFNNFLNACLILNHSFPYKKHFSKQYNKTWITNGTRTSCARKRELYVLSGTTDNPELLRYYKIYCKILSDIIKLAKKHYYNKLIINSKNKVKTTWGIIKSLTNIKPSKSITSISNKGKSYNNPQTMANIFNNYCIMPPNQMQLNKLTNVSDSLSYLSKVHK